jgi:hypothetical protein
MTLTTLVLVMVSGAAVAAVWREYRRGLDLRQFQSWSGLGRRAMTRPAVAFKWNRVGFIVVSAVCCGLSAIWPGSDANAPRDDDLGPDLVVAVDTSKSMFASDVSPSRLHEAVMQLHAVIRSAPVAHVAIVGFAGSAAIVCPLTDDRDAAVEFLDQLEREPVGGRGSDLGLGLRRAADALASARGDRVVLLVSDGEATTTDLDLPIARIRREGIRFLTVGVGTLEGAPVPVQPGSTEFQRDPVDSRRPVTAILQEDTLIEIARQTGGTYQRLKAGDDLSAALRSAWKRPVDGFLRGTSSALAARAILLIALAALGLDAALPLIRNRRSAFE